MRPYEATWLSPSHPYFRSRAHFALINAFLWPNTCQRAAGCYFWMLVSQRKQKSGSIDEKQSALALCVFQVWQTAWLDVFLLSPRQEPRAFQVAILICLDQKLSRILKQTWTKIRHRSKDCLKWKMDSTFELPSAFLNRTAYPGSALKSSFLHK